MSLPTDEILTCGCGRELAFVEIAGRPTLAHTTNPTFQHHYPKVRLARSSALPGVASQRSAGLRTFEGSDVRREDDVPPDPSTSTGAPKGAARARASMPVDSHGRRVERGSPRPRSAPALKAAT